MTRIAANTITTPELPAMSRDDDLQTGAASDIRTQSEAPRRSSHGTNVRRLRLRPRKSAEGSVVVEMNGRYCAAELVDQSDLGAGLMMQGTVSVGDDVRLHYPDGKLVVGRIIWARGARVGIEFRKRPADFPPSSLRMDASHSRWLRDVASSIKAVVGRLTGAEGRRAKSHSRLIERACRKNGFAWLAESEAELEIGRSNSRSDLK